MRASWDLRSRFQRCGKRVKRDRPRWRNCLDQIESLESRVVLSVGGGSTAAGFVGAVLQQPQSLRHARIHSQRREDQFQLGGHVYSRRID